MKTQIVILSLALLAVNGPESVTTLSTTTNKGSNVTKPQSTEFAFFRIHRQGKAVTATWGLNSTSSTGCFMVQRTYQDASDPYAFWEDLNYVPCNPSRSFKWTDENVFPGFVSYRIVAYQFDGSTVCSNINQVRIVGH